MLEYGRAVVCLFFAMFFIGNGLVNLITNGGSKSVSLIYVAAGVVFTEELCLIAETLFP